MKKDQEDLKKKKLQVWIVYITTCITLILIIIIIWNISRQIHYKFGYKNMVNQQIIEMVKPEALKDKYKKGS